MSSSAKKSAARERHSRCTPAAVLIVTLGAGLSWAPAPISEHIDAVLSFVRNALSPAPAFAGDDEESRSRVQTGISERQREEQKKLAERRREEQKQQVEKQREQQKQQLERQSEGHTSEIHADETEIKSPSESGDGVNSHESHDESDGEHHSDGHSSAGKDEEDDGPPQTIEEAWQRLTQGTKKKAGARAPVDLPAKGQSSFAPREIIATNLGHLARDRARALGFNIVSSVDLSNLGMRFERLIAPKGMEVAEASRLLKAEIPTGEFSPNHLYRVYRSAEGDRLVPPPESTAHAGRLEEGSCEGDHCFGRSLIRWNPNLRTCARRVRVGIIDTSVDLTHPAFAGHRFNIGYFLADGASSIHDWHGTAVLSILAGDARSSTPGLIPDAEFYLASAFQSDENGDSATDTVSLLKALAWLDALDVRLVNMSFSGPRDDLLESALTQMHAKGVVFVAAAGNEGPTAPPSYPAAYPSVIAVTAVSKTLHGYRYANRGLYVDLAAPGVDIWTALPNGKQGYKSGTSFAAPFVTSIIATMQKTEVLPSSKAELLKRLAFKDLGEQGRDPVYGEGLPISPGSCGATPSVATRTAPPEFGPQMSIGAAGASPDLQATFSWAPTGAPD